MFNEASKGQHWLRNIPARLINNKEGRPFLRERYTTLPSIVGKRDGMRGGKPSATGGSANNAHDAVATMEIIIKLSTCNDLWALSLVRVANNRSTAVRLTAGNRPGPLLLAILRCLMSVGPSRLRCRQKASSRYLQPRATETVGEMIEVRSCGNFRDIRDSLRIDS